jgi:hypothetical protein
MKAAYEERQQELTVFREHFLWDSAVKLMEQQLINLLMKLLSRAGGGSFIKDLIQEVDQDGNPKTWTPAELEKAIVHVTRQIENFGTPEASAIIETLTRKFNLRADDLIIADDSLPETPGVQGLQ